MPTGLVATRPITSSPERVPVVPSTVLVPVSGWGASNRQEVWVESRVQPVKARAAWRTPASGELGRVLFGVWGTDGGIRPRVGSGAARRRRQSVDARIRPGGIEHVLDRAPITPCGVLVELAR